MRKFVGYSVLTSFVLLSVAIVAGLLVLSHLVTLPERSNTYVVGVPAVVSSEGVGAYRGPHPRFYSRPEEAFSFPITLGQTGPVQPLFAGENRYPFLCGADKIYKAQPMIDNMHQQGVPVYAEDERGVITDEVLGYSKDCSHTTKARYYYNRIGSNKFYPLEEAKGDIAKIVVNNKEIDYVVRLETGTINRFFYGIAVLKGGGTIDNPDAENWNQRLVYQLRGGVGIGRRQGKINHTDLLKRRHDVLQKGYAVVYSTANQTSNHYNVWLAEDTALRVKKQFSSLYGEPSYTVGIGGSGGAIQQYLFAQNNPEVIDAAIALYAYPDMVTQTTYVMDCEPLEYYFDVTDKSNPRWKSWEERSIVQGLNADDDVASRFSYLSYAASLLQGRSPKPLKGSSGCVAGWRGLTPLVHNPNFVHFHKQYRKHIAAKEHWTHWDDLKKFYGVDQYGYANSTWDNVGVQYGLEAMIKGQLSTEEFLRLNAHVGGWKPFQNMKNEKFWLMQGNVFPVDYSQWSHHNMNLSEDGGMTPAKRTVGSMEAMQGAYRSGHVFVGHADIPIIDLRHYLENELDMHHVTASFAARVRLQKGQGHADNQLIWVAAKPHTPIIEALDLVDKWLENNRNNPQKTLVENKPPQAQDKCFAATGDVIAVGNNVWDGEWNGKPKGECMAVYPRYKTTREVAGEGLAGDIFKCQLQSVETAISRGVYGDVDMAKYTQQLQRIFADGVCDYSKPDMGLPVASWFTPIEERVVDKVKVVEGELVSADESESSDGEAMTLSLLEDMEP